MVDTDKTKAQLIEELETLRIRVIDLEHVETERIKMEMFLRKSEEKYRHLVESTLDWVWATDTEGHHTFSNEAVKQLLGYEVNEIVGTSAFSLIHPEDQARIQELVQRSVEQKNGWTGIAIRWLHRDGSVRYFESTAQPILGNDGQLKGFNGIDRNITERVQAEDELRKYRDHLEEVVEERTADLVQSHEALTREIIERKQVEETLLQRDTMLRTVHIVAEQLLKTTEWQQDITAILENLGTMVNLDRVAIFEKQSREDDSVHAVLRFKL